MSYDHSPARQSFNGLEKSKYTVMKNRDPHSKHVSCQYFVLDPRHDLAALRSLVYYRDTILSGIPLPSGEQGFITPEQAALAADLMVWINQLYNSYWPNEKNLLSWAASHSSNLVDVETTGLLPDPTPKTQQVPSEEWMDEQAFEDYIAQLRNARWDAIRAKKAAEGDERYMTHSPELLTDRFAAARAKTGYWDVVRAEQAEKRTSREAQQVKNQELNQQELAAAQRRRREYR